MTIDRIRNSVRVAKRATHMAMPNEERRGSRGWMEGERKKRTRRRRVAGETKPLYHVRKKLSISILVRATKYKTLFRNMNGESLCVCSERNSTRWNQAKWKTKNWPKIMENHSKLRGERRKSVSFARNASIWNGYESFLWSNKWLVEFTSSYIAHSMCVCSFERLFPALCYFFSSHFKRERESKEKNNEWRKKRCLNGQFIRPKSLSFSFAVCVHLLRVAFFPLPKSANSIA